jgi:hypothetical protein
VIKGVLTKADGTPILLLGVTGESVTRIVAGEPIRVAADEVEAMSLPRVEVVIMYGKTHQDVVDQLRAAGLMASGEPVLNACTDPNCREDHAR